jgi:Cd2+/Zn2+-exporting ATPase
VRTRSKTAVYSQLTIHHSPFTIDHSHIDINMKKIQLNIDLLLPDVPDEKDACVRRILEELKDEPGLEKVHVLPAKDAQPAQLCLHIDTSVTTIKEVEKIAKEAGARITERYRHLLLEVRGIRHQRQTSLIETQLRNKKGILGASVSGTGNVLIEYDNTLTNRDEVMLLLKKEGLSVVEPAQQQATDDHAHAHGEEDHHHGGLLGPNSELYFSLICGLFTGVAWALEKWADVHPGITLALFGVAYLTGGYYSERSRADDRQRRI